MGNQKRDEEEEIEEVLENDEEKVEALCLKILTKFLLLSRYESTFTLKPLTMHFHS